MELNVAIVGATGMVGRTFLKVLEEYNLPITNLKCLASHRSKGSVLQYKNESIIVEELTEHSFHNVHIALFSAGGAISKKFAPIAVESGCIVIDNSSAFRMDKDVPLVVPEVNKDTIKNHKGIIANPNCSTIQAMVALKPLHDKYKIKRIVYSTYQAVSGAGQNGIDDLKNNNCNKFSKPILNNCIPQIDIPSDNGYYYEEIKMINETLKILNAPDLKVTATTVRVPVMNCHSESINIEFFNDFDLDDVFKILKSAEGVIIVDDFEKNIFPTPLDCNDKNEVFVGRIRRDFSIDNGLNLWVVADNVRKGAATNAVQIAKVLIEDMSFNI